MQRSPVSICMATYNGARFITEQLSSILCQLQDDDELIISDDGSTDETVTIIREFKDPRVKFLEGAELKNLIRNFSHALSHARHDLIFLADQDDVWFEHKVETVTQLLQIYDLVVTDCTLIDADGALLADSFFKQHGSRAGFLSNLMSNSYLGCCMAFRRSLLEKALPIPLSVPMHDIWLGILAEWYGRPYFYPKPLMAYRRHGVNVSTTGTPSTRSLWQKLGSRYHLLLCLARRIAELRQVSR